MINKFNIPHNVVAAVGALVISTSCIVATIGPVNAGTSVQAQVSGQGHSAPLAGYQRA